MEKFFKILGITVGAIATLGAAYFVVDSLLQKKREKELTKSLYEGEGPAPDDIAIIAGCDNCDNCDNCNECNE